MTENIAAEERDREELARSKLTLPLLFAFLGGPLAGMLMVWINYPLVDRACVSGNRLWLHASSAFFLLIAILAALDAWRFYERAGDFPLTEGGVMPRTRFMALVGLFTATLGIITIFFQWIPILFLGSCIGS